MLDCDAAGILRITGGFMKLDALKGAAAVAAMAFAMAGTARADDMTIGAGKLAKNAKDFYGKTVSVKAEVEDVLGDNMFTLDEDALLGGADVLVLVPRGLAGKLAHDQKVIVTGKVRQYVEADLDKDYDWFDNGKLVDVKTKVDWKTRPVIVADTIRTESGTEIALK